MFRPPIVAIFREVFFEGILTTLLLPYLSLSVGFVASRPLRELEGLFRLIHVGCPCKTHDQLRTQHLVLEFC